MCIRVHTGVCAYVFVYVCMCVCMFGSRMQKDIMRGGTHAKRTWAHKRSARAHTHTPALYLLLPSKDFVQKTCDATHCNTLQHTATHCNTL